MIWENWKLQKKEKEKLAYIVISDFSELEIEESGEFLKSAARNLSVVP